MFRAVAAIQNPVDIVFLYFDEGIADLILRICEEKFDAVSYSFFGMYYWDKTIVDELEKAIYSDYVADGTSYDDRFLFLRGSLDNFFSCVEDYLPEYDGSKEFSDRTIQKLPSSKGWMEISENQAVNLGEYFDCLYDNCGDVSPEKEAEELDLFYHGGEVSWSVFKRNGAIQLLRDEEYSKNLNRVRSSLGKMQEKAKDKIFYISHLPGIGGSTLLRQMGWDIHDSYPVLLLQRYEKGRTIEQVRKLYDTVVKGILILVDDDFCSLADFENEVRVLNRPCSLLASVREENDASSSCYRMPFSAITGKAEESLKRLFRAKSILTKSQLSEKDRLYSDFVGVDKDGKRRMRVPFMIGLYYLDKHFSRVDEYVRGIADSCDKRLLEAIAFILLCDIYGNGSQLPMVFINRYTNNASRDDLLKKYSFLNRALYIHDGAGTTCYRSRHYVISKELLRLCGEKRFGKNPSEALYDWSILFADAVFSGCSEQEFETYCKILEQLFIRNRIGLSSSEVSDSIHSDFSMLMEEIPVPEQRRDLLLHLAEKTEKLCESCSPEENPDIYMATSHYYGHLGRLYQKQFKNMDKAGESSEKSVRYMELCKKDDPLVYHMHGMMKKNALREEYDCLKNNGQTVTDSEYEKLEEQVENTLAVFGQATNGSPVYAYTGSIELIFDYLQFVYQTKNIRNDRDFLKLSSRQRQFQMEVEEFIDLLEAMELDDSELQYYNTLLDRYKSNIMLGDFSKAIEYYQNRLDALRNKPDFAVEIINARKCLISARLGKYRMKDNSGSYFKQIPKKEAEAILALLEESFSELMPSSFRDRQRRMNAYSRWMNLAKYSGKSVDEGLKYASGWAELQEKSNIQDPRPYYYLYVLYYLSVLEGYKENLQKATFYRKKAGQLAERTGYSTNRIRDVFVDGNGMSQLRDCHDIEDLGDIFSTRDIPYRKFEGIFERIESKKGIVRLQSPSKWEGEQVKFRSEEKNTLGEKQVSHRVAFYGGFSYEQLCAFDGTVKDINTGESLAEPKLS